MTFNRGVVYFKHETCMVDSTDDDPSLVGVAMKIAGRRKITVGFVIQTYSDDGHGLDCIAQEFVAGDQVDWEDGEGEFIPTPVHNYHPFEMVQPATEGLIDLSANGVVLTDGGIIEHPEDYDGAIRRRDKDGNMMEVREPGDEGYEEWQDLFPTTVCRLCDKKVFLQTAHWHQGSYIGDECCWDKRLRSAE